MGWSEKPAAREKSDRFARISAFVSTCVFFAAGAFKLAQVTTICSSLEPTAHSVPAVARRYGQTRLQRMGDREKQAYLAFVQIAQMESQAAGAYIGGIRMTPGL